MNREWTLSGSRLHRKQLVIAADLTLFSSSPALARYLRDAEQRAGPIFLPYSDVAGQNSTEGRGANVCTAVFFIKIIRIQTFE